MSDDSWEGESGLLTNYEGEVVQATFDDSGQYGTQLVLTLSTDVPERPETKEFYKVGNGWATLDGGDTIYNTDGKTKFNRNTAYHQFYTRAASLAGNDLKARGDTTDAKIWVGTKWFMEEVVTEARGEIPAYSRNYPSKFLGFVDGGRTTAPTKSDADPLALLTIDTQVEMKNHAKNLQHGEWVDTVLGLDEVLKQPKVIAALSDQSDNGIYQRLKNE